MKVKRTLVIAGVVQMLVGIVLLIVLLSSSNNGVMAWVSTILLLIFGLVETIIAAVGN